MGSNRIIRKAAAFALSAMFLTSALQPAAYAEEKDEIDSAQTAFAETEDLSLTSGG